jgi:hypothetical protein
VCLGVCVIVVVLLSWVGSLWVLQGSIGCSCLRLFRHGGSESSMGVVTDV